MLYDTGTASFSSIKKMNTREVYQLLLLMLTMMMMQGSCRCC